ncbi:hypothetical protein CAOG_07928 [Capsaspora owczarzaki ATCC 30864]|uniref:MMS19 nucleotide excision repair protein n=1 Tax=Capsaspora owczarzaki (strain ATCC 30864) TaxID=595528 RepID=A0A0D2X5I0_CAPO3|nr:hypothetical protein CAOG_07928 [Capsaspora owczarzaki ATCC 30864]KJE97844.1 hypothetical protein CAOG_007928 [Capsaspora owczarzaki ATCC 30864]KJE97845.1 hypothetical protein, variant [Capsaspora owczarzaki ATCC 30864]|eukprot:XP_004343013.1 hypothetical protein CAOG_07928 [Capsaspora owczarzaki ATCC 30864]
MSAALSELVAKALSAAPGLDGRDAALRLAQFIAEDTSRLTTLVEHLAPQLTASAGDLRIRGTQLLANVLKAVDRENPSSVPLARVLPIVQIELLVAFFIDRLRDLPCVPHVLDALTTLASETNLSKEHILSILRTMFAEVHVPTLPFGARYAALNLLLVIVQRYLGFAQTAGADFVYGLVQAIDGEKDPRNLLLAFKLHVLAIRHFPFNMFVEDLAEVVSVYFPITFSPPPNDPYGITREELVLALRDCFVVSPLLAPFLLPTILEKLASTSAKVQSLQTLTACASAFGKVGLAPFLLEIGTQLRGEMFHTGEEDVEKAILETMTAISRVISSGQDQSLFVTFMQPMIVECARHLKEPELKLAHPSASLLQAAAVASSSACEFVLLNSIPMLSEQYNAATDVTVKRANLDLLLGFLKASKSLQVTNEQHPLATYSSVLASIFQSAVSHEHPNVRCAGITGLVGLLIVQGVATAEQISSSLSTFLRLATLDLEQIVRTQATAALAVTVNAEVADLVLTSLSESLTTVTLEQAAARKQLWVILTEISNTPPLLRRTAPLFLNQLQTLLASAVAMPMDTSTTSSPSAAASSSPEQVEFEVVLESVANIVAKGASQQQEVALRPSTLAETILLPVLSLAFSLSAEPGTLGGVVSTNQSVVETLARIVRNIVCAASVQDCSSQLSTAVQTAFAALTDPTTSPIRSVDVNAATSRKILVASAVLCCGPRELVLSLQSDFAAMLPKITLLALHSPDADTRRYCCMMAGAIINHLEDQDLSKHVETALLPQLEQLLRAACTAAPATAAQDQQQRAALALWIWITKALFIRGHALGDRMVSLLLTDCVRAPLLADVAAAPSSFAQQAAESMHTILTDSEEVLSKRTRANFRIMYKQRLFTSKSALIVQGYAATDDEHKQFYLTALSHMLQNVPKQVLLTELPSLLPLLFQSLSHANVGLRLSTINSVYLLLFDAPALLASHTPTLIKHMMALSTSPDSMKLRIAALQCLGLMATALPAQATFPSRNVVVSGLAKAVDDPKRLVRVEAVKARNEWYLLVKSTKG